MTDEKERNKNDVWNIIEGQIKNNTNLALNTP